MGRCHDPFSKPFKDVFIKKTWLTVCPGGSNGHAENHTGRRLPALLPEVGTMFTLLCSCSRELF